MKTKKDLQEETLIEQEQTAPVDVEAGSDTDEDGAKLRSYRNKYTKWFVAFVAISMSLYHIWGLGIKIIDPSVFYCCHWGFGTALAFLLYPAAKKEDRHKIPFYDWIIVGLITFIVFYIIRNYQAFLYRAMTNNPSTLDLILGVIAIAVTLEATRRTVGKGLCIVAIVLILYAFFGNFLPSFISNRGYDFNRVVSYLFSTEGIFGTAMKMSATNVFLMVLFGSFLTMSGAGDFFMRIAMALTGKSRGGPAKVSVVSSGLFGSISGSAVANVVGTGNFTIPLMKKTGYKAHFAGAVEAVASTGGQIMPPVMGTGAFLMAEMINIAYGKIALAALLPALLYYFSVFISIDLEAAKNDLTGLDEDSVEKPLDVLKEGWHLLIPIVVLIYFLAIRQSSVSLSALISMAACVVCSWFRKETRMDFKKIVKTLEVGAYRTVTIVTAVGCAGLAIGVIMLTGLGIKFTLVVSTIAGSSLFLALVFSALAAIILGMGLPTVAAYIICASVMVAGLVKLGIEPISAHMFIFYYSILSMLTPPVALAAYTAAGIADANPNKVGFTSMRLGAVAFVLPFFFIYGPALLMVGTAWEIILATVTSIIGIVLFTIALYGWLMGKTIHWTMRILLLGGGLCLVMPGTLTDVIGLAVLAIFAVSFKPLRNRITHLKRRNEK